MDSCHSRAVGISRSSRTCNYMIVLEKNTRFSSENTHDVCVLYRHSTLANSLLSDPLWSVYKEMERDQVIDPWFFVPSHTTGTSKVEWVKRPLFCHLAAYMGPVCSMFLCLFWGLHGRKKAGNSNVGKGIFAFLSNFPLWPLRADGWERKWQHFIGRERSPIKCAGIERYGGRTSWWVWQLGIVSK